MNQNEEHAFGPESVLVRIKGGKLELRYSRDHIVYSQGDPADCVFYALAGKVKMAVVSVEGRKLLSQSSSPVISAASSASLDTSYVSPQSPR
jgi:hypothetical protein